MRVLLLSANTGEGHNSTGKALMDVLKARNIECKMEDTLAYISPGFSKFICGWHVRLYRYGGPIFDIAYRFTERMADPTDTNPISQLLSVGASKLRNAILAGDYDAIITVHPFTASMVTDIRRRWGLKIPCFFVATDYSCCPTVDQCEMDRYFIPAKGLTSEFVQMGISKLQLSPLGIPVRQPFYTREPRPEVRQRLGLPEKARIVLLMCGSMGCGPIQKVAEDLVKKLPEDGLLIAVCGSNKRLFKAMSRIRHPQLRVLGFTRNIPEYMDAVDLIITKPGGLSSTEAANKALPIVFINTIGGCENHNFDYFIKHGYATGSTNAAEVVKQTAELIVDDQRLEQMSRAMEAAFTVNSAQAIVDQVVEAAEEYRAGLELAAAK